MSDAKTTVVESVLGVLSLGPMSGYEIRRFMEQSTGNFWSESFGQIYPALKRMLAEGLVEVDGKAEASSGGRPARKVYRITESGLERLRDWLGVRLKPHKNRNELLLKVFFGSQAEKGVIAAQVELWRERYAADLKRYMGIERDLQKGQARNPSLPFSLITVRYGIAEARALIKWCDDTLWELEKRGMKY
jgi:PadR family transcriptional regulator, regulatory protein AphA